MSAVVFFVLVALAIFVGVCVIKVVPATLVSLLRYRLWRIRDDLFDEIHNGGFMDTREPRLALEELERTIAVAPELTLAKVALAGAIARKRRFVPIPIPNAANAHPDDRPKLEAVIREYRVRTVAHVVFGTPSGWLIVVSMSWLVIPVMLVRAVVWCIRHSPTQAIKRACTGSAVRAFLLSPVEERVELGVAESLVFASDNGRHHTRGSLYT